MKEFSTVSPRWMLPGLFCAWLFGCAAAAIVGGPIPAGKLIDGTYEGQARDGPVKVAAQVAVRDHRIAEIRLLEHRNGRGAAAGNAIPGRIMEARSTKVDAVSGATGSSRVIMNAVEDAVRKAQ